MIIVDTNVLVALTDRDDQHHSLCRNWLATTEAPLLVPSTVLAEACYLIDRELGPETEAAFLDDVGTSVDRRTGRFGPRSQFSVPYPDRHLTGPARGPQGGDVSQCNANGGAGGPGGTGADAEY